MNTRNAPTRDFHSLLEKSRQCSRYARRVLQADPNLLDWLRDNYSIPCDRAGILALLGLSGLNLADEAQ